VILRLFIGRLAAEEKEIDKNAPAKRGAALFVDILRREWWELMKLNLLMVLFFLPVVTIPAALAGTTRIATAMLRDENHYLWRDFWETFRAEFLRATLLGWGLIGLIGIGAGSTVAYARELSSDSLFAIPAVIAAFGTVLLILVASHSLSMMIETDLPTAKVLRNACLLSVIRFFPGFAAITVCAAIWILHIIAYPVSVFIPATFGFSFCALVMTFISRGALLKFVVRPPAAGPSDGNTSFE